MKIGIVTTWFERGAAYVSKQYEQVLEQEHDVFIYARGGEEYAQKDSEWDKDNVYWGKRISSPVSTYIDKKDFIKWLLDNKIELVIFNEQRWWEPIFICNKMEIKTVAYIDYYTEETMPFFAAYDALLCNTKKHYKAFSWHEQTFYIPWGTDIDLFTYNKTSQSDKVRFFHSCGVSPGRKGTELLIKAFDKLYINTQNCILIIHTKINIEQSLPDSKKIIQDLKHKGALEIIEKTVSAPGLYCKGDIYVYPTQLEGIGLTIAEAISSGLPTIVPNDGPMNEFVEDGISGKLVKVKRLFARSDGYYWPKNECDIKDLTKQMAYYVENINKIDDYKNGAREYAVKYLNWNKNITQINNLMGTIRFLEKSITIEKKVRKYFLEKFPGIYSFHWLYRLVYIVYKKLK